LGENVLKYESNEIFKSQYVSSFEELFSDLLSSVSGISESTIERYFNAEGMGARSKSLAGTVRKLLVNDLQLKGWQPNWTPFKGTTGLESSVWSFDAARRTQFNGEDFWVTVEISFDNRVALGTHLMKAEVANSLKFRNPSIPEPILHHCIIAASKAFRESAGIDNSVASAEEFANASKVYDDLTSVGTTLLSLQPLETIEILQRKFEGRKMSKLLNLASKSDS
jgi:hypothetical protein